MQGSWVWSLGRKADPTYPALSQVPHPHSLQGGEPGSVPFGLQITLPVAISIFTPLS